MHIYQIDSGDISLAAATAKTALQLVTGATRRAKIKEIGISGSSVSLSDPPILIELRSQSTAGVSSAYTPAFTDGNDPAAISTSRNIFTTEPTDVALMGPGPWRLTPVGGLIIYQFDDTTDEGKMAISTRVGLRLTSANPLTNVRVYMIFRE